MIAAWGWVSKAVAMALSRSLMRRRSPRRSVATWATRTAAVSCRVARRTARLRRRGRVGYLLDVQGAVAAEVYGSGCHQTRIRSLRTHRIDHAPVRQSNRTPAADRLARSTLPSALRSSLPAARSARRSRCCAGPAPRPAWPSRTEPRRVLAAVPRSCAEVRRSCRLASRSLAVTTLRSMQKSDRRASGPGQSRGHVSPWPARTVTCRLPARFGC